MPAGRTAAGRGKKGAPPYSGAEWPADEDIDVVLLRLARALAEGAPDRAVSIAELGDQIAVRLRQKGVHPKRDGKIVRLSAYMRGVHGGWESFLGAHAPAPLCVEGGALRVRAAAAEGLDARAAVPLATGGGAPGPRSGREAGGPVSVDELDLSRL